MSDALKRRDDFGRRLEGLERARRRRRFMAGISILAAGTAAAWVVSTGLLSIFPGLRLMPAAVFALFWSAVAVSVAAGARASAGGIAARPGELAWELGRRSGNGSLIASAWEFSRGGERLGRFSGILLSRTIEEAGKALQAFDAAPILAEAGRPRWTAAALAAATAVLVQTLADPGATGSTLRALGDPGISFRTRTSNGLIAAPHRAAVLSGDDAVVTAVRAGSRRDPVHVEWSVVPGIWQSTEARADTIAGGVASLEAFRHRFAGVREEIVFRFESGGDRTAQHTIRVLRRPVINRIDAIVEPPSYLAAAPETLRAAAGRIAAPAGAMVRLSGETSAPLAAALMRSSSGADRILEPVPGGFAGALVVTGDDTLGFVVTDLAGLENEDPPSIVMDAVADRPPAVEIISPDDGAPIPRSQHVTVVFGAVDDHGQ
ncbi:MAG: hypothetical protein PHQ19_00650, partial [Candidatus Krumholzibacteria bacterium]|nr:hypothetical protein [Candidatus Krumholzibacteria bacterium]